MIKTLSNKFINYLAKRNIIKDEYEIYQYGFELLLSYSIGMIVIVTISIVTDSFLSALIYLISFYYIRKFTGGYHCKTYLLCNLSFIVIYLLYSFLCKTLFMNQNVHVVYVIAFLIIWILAPCDHENKVLSETEVQKYGGISKIVLIIYSFILICVGWIKPELMISLELTLSIIAILLILGKIERSVNKHA